MDEKSDAVLSERCHGCLASGRNLRRAAEEFHSLIYSLIGNQQGLSLDSMMFCWECTSSMRKIKRFKTNILIALAAFESTDAFNFEKLDYSLSTLTAVHRSNEDFIMRFDSEMYSQRPKRFITKNTAFLEYTMTDLNSEPSDNENDSNTVDSKVPMKTGARKSRKTVNKNKCSTCNAEFGTNRALRYHRECAHKEKKKCHFCSKEFSNSSTYKKHLLLHTGMPLHACTICGKKYRGAHGLRAHKRTHNSEPSEDAYCVVCNKQFKNKYLYKHHIKTSVAHTDPTKFRFPCALCDRRFFVASQLRSHEDTVHLKRRDHKCVLCDKAFSTRYKLKSHSKIVHEGVPLEKSHICETCGRGFTTRQQALRHAAIHSNERPYSCDICSAKFRQPAALYTHRKLLHSADKN